MIATSDGDEMRFVAYHEAGHAVAQHLLGWGLFFVGIARGQGPVDSWKGGSRGRNRSTPEGAVIAYSGPLAEAKSRGIEVSDDELLAGKIPSGVADLGGWRSDVERAQQFAEAADLKCYVARARILIATKSAWGAIAALADELCSAARLRITTIREIPEDIQSAILPGFGPDSYDKHSAKHSILMGDDAIKIIQKHALPGSVP